MAEIKKILAQPRADLLLEVSWEVCNKIGGINTVLATKAAQMVKRYHHNNYILVGPYFEPGSQSQIEEKAPEGKMKDVFDSLAKQGIKCHFGNWLIEGEPQVILVDFAALWPNVNSYKGQLWEAYKIDSMNAGFEFDEQVVMGYAAARLAEQIKRVFSEKELVMHCHEWLAGAALLFAKKFCGQIATVFTTHATTLGRSLAFGGADIYANIDKIDALKEAYNFHIQAKHLMEKAAANECTVFTTVSEITGVECQYFLGRMPDVFLPNGLDVGGYLSFEEAAIKHRIQRARIREFLFYYFFPHYTFDLKNTQFYFMMARYEFHAKGIDAFIKALGDLNRKLVGERSDKTVVAFLWIPAKTNGMKQELIENRGSYYDVKQFVDENSSGLMENFMYSLVAGKDLKDTDVFEGELHRSLDRKLKKARRNGLPLICTHDLDNRNDAILQALDNEGLDNKEGNRVKVVFYPAYLTGTDRLLNLSMQEAIAGCHLGVFPSFYEPWGYTPLEAAAEGVSAITSDLSGLGRFLTQIDRNDDYPGIFIVNNYEKSQKEVEEQLGCMLYKFCNLSRRERVENKINARALVNYFDWENLAENYVIAQNKAVEMEGNK